MKSFIKTLAIALMICLLLPTSVFAQAEQVDVVKDVVDTSKHNYNFTEMQDDLNVLQQKYSDKLKVSAVGTSVDGRAIYQAILGNPQAKNAIFIMSTIHGREWMNSWILMEMLEFNLDNWDNIAPNGETYGNVFNDCCIYLLPMVNPDGVEISQNGFNVINNEELRNSLKTMRGAGNTKRWKANAHGVDLNRNFGTGWNSKVDQTTPGADFYNGPNAWSEPETLAVKSALEQRGFIAALTYHSAERTLYWDLGQEGQMRERTQALVTHCHNINGYKYGEASPLKGLEYNYMNFDKQIPTVCIETGTVACPLPYSQFKTIWKENHMMMVALAGCYQ